MIEITIDDRERNDRLITALQQAGSKVLIKRLETGDYLVDNLVIERKSFQDFCISITDGRLFRQATRLTGIPEQPLIILEGVLDDWQKMNVTSEAIQGALITIILIFRIPLLYSPSPEETAKIILFAASQLKRSSYLNNTYPRHNGKNKASKKQKIQSHVLQGFPGIGPKRAKELLNKFETLSAIFNASHHQLANVAGMGKSRIKNLIDWIN